MTSDTIAEPNGVQRRGFLKCMTWAGTAMVWTVAGGIPRSQLIGSAEAAATDFTFVQISDSHLGFDKPANTDVTSTLKLALDDVGALKKKPAFMIHTGDITHLSKPAQFDTAASFVAATKLTMHKCRANTTSWRRTARATSTASARVPKATAGTASTMAACISSAWST